LVTAEEASRHVTVDDVKTAHWYFSDEILWGFCGINGEWKYFSALVKKVGIRHFADTLDSVIKSCWDEVINRDLTKVNWRNASDVFAGNIHQKHDAIGKWMAVNGISYQPRLQLEAAYLSLVLYGMGKVSEPDLILNMLSTKDVSELVSFHESGASIDAVKALSESSVDANLATELLKGA